MASEESEEKDRGFKVQDRRRFSAEGEARTEGDDAPVEAPTEESRTEPTAKPGAAAGQSKQPAHEPIGPEPEITFVNFVVGLSSEALAALGEMPDPITGELRRDLRAAQQLIDIIGLLRDKTRGNLDQDEQSLLEAILFDLRMKYVELARQTTK